MVNPAPCWRRSRSHIHSMLLCLLLAKPGIAAYCCAKNKSIKPRHRSGATVRFLCQAFFLVKESGEGRDPSFPSPHTPRPQEPSRDCCGSLGSSLGGMRRLLCGGRPPDRPCRSSNGCALLLARAVFLRRNQLLPARLCSQSSFACGLRASTCGMFNAAGSLRRGKTERR